MPLSPKEQAVLKLIKEDIAYENYFFRKANDFKWFDALEKEGYFSPEKAPGPKLTDQKGSYYIPEWNVLQYLERLAGQTRNLYYETYVSRVLRIIECVTNYKDKKGKRIDNFRTWWSYIKILINIPNKDIPEAIIDLIPIWLESQYETTIVGAEIIERLLPKFLNDDGSRDDIIKAERIINHITDLKEISLGEEKTNLFGVARKYELKCDPYWLERYFEGNSRLVAEKCSNQPIVGISSKIKKVLENPEDGVYRPLTDDTRRYDIADMLTFLLRNLLVAKAEIKPGEIEEILSEYLTSEYIYFQRIAIYILSKYVNTFAKLIWQNIAQILGDSVSRTLWVGDELRMLLQNLQQLSPAQIAKLTEIIESGPLKDIPADNPELHKRLWKQKYYWALRSTPEFETKYKELRERSSSESIMNSAVVKIETKWGSGDSPLTEDQILSKTNEELAKIFSEFKTVSRWEGPTVDGLSEMVKSVIQKNPEKIAGNLEPFLKTGSLYIYEMLWGFRDAWKNKKQIGWGNILAFVHRYINQEEFWKDKLVVEGSHWGANHRWVIRTIGDLIREGCGSDDWAFEAEYLTTADAICELTISRLLEENKNEEESDNPVGHALNSPFGTIITAFIFLQLRKARLAKAEGSRWEARTKNTYNILLSKKIAEAYTLVGQYIVNFWYLDKEWTIGRIQEFKKTEDLSWSSFMVGYLYSSLIYDEIYQLMKDHYSRAVDYDFKDRIAEERFIQHLALGYLRGHEGLIEGNLLLRILNKLKPSHIDILVRYLRSQFEYALRTRDQQDSSAEQAPDIETKILDIWRYIYTQLRAKPTLSGEDDEILRALLMLTMALPSLDGEKYEWLAYSISKVKGQYAEHLFIKDLIVLKERGDKTENSRHLGKIILKILDVGTPSWFQENIRSLVTFVFESGDGEAMQHASEICNKFAERGVTDEKGNPFLADLYKKYCEPPSSKP